MNSIIKIINTLREYDHYGAGKHTEIAKGKHELVTDWESVKKKIKRQWQSRKI